MFFILLIIVLLGLAADWLVTCGIIYLITLCFGVTFSWYISTGVWLIMLLLYGIFNKSDIT